MTGERNGIAKFGSSVMFASCSRWNVVLFRRVDLAVVRLLVPAHASCIFGRRGGSPTLFELLPRSVDVDILSCFRNASFPLSQPYQLDVR